MKNLGSKLTTFLQILPFVEVLALKIKLLFFIFDMILIRLGGILEEI